MNKSELNKMLIMVAANFNHGLDKSRLLILNQLIGDTLGFDHDWATAGRRIVLNEFYFPSVAVIKKHLGANYTKSIDQMSIEEKAKLCVDQFIGYLTGAIPVADVGTEDLKYFKRRFNCDKYSYQCGSVNLDFKRKEWVEMAKLDFEFGYKDPSQMQIEDKNVLKIVGDVLKLKD